MRRPHVTGFVRSLAAVLGTALAATTVLPDLGWSQPFPNEEAPLGVNLGGIVDWNTAVPFTDAFRQARPWIPQLHDNSVWDTGAPLDLAADGYPASLAPGQAAGTVLITAQGANYPAGDYVCLYDGSGTLDFRLDAEIVSSEPGRIVVHIDPSPDGLTHMKILTTDPADHVRNIRLFLPGFEGTAEIFHPDFLASLAQFRVLRFMDWMRTNDSTQSNWSGRATPAYFSQGTERGVCVEIMVDLCNRLGADPWFCLPHLADDDYIAAFATYVRDHLDPSLRIYVEHSNEVWNGIFSQADYARDRGLELGLSANPFEAQLRYHSRRSVEIFRIWDDVFGGSERLVRVLAAQHANPWTGTTVMDWQSAYLEADALGTAPYFGGSFGTPGNAEITRTWTVAQLLAACADDVVAQRSTTATNAANAAARGLDLVAYEGGQHLVGVGGWENDATLTALFHAANRDIGMRGLYLDDLLGWHDTAGGVHVAFSHIGAYSKWGSWGLLEAQSQDPASAPKWMGVGDFLAAVGGSAAVGTQDGGAGPVVGGAADGGADSEEDAVPGSGRGGPAPDSGGGTMTSLVLAASPNPFHDTVHFATERGTPFEDPITVQILTVDGRVVRRFAGLAGGALFWDGRDARGREVPAGSYLAIVPNARGGSGSGARAVARIVKVG